MHRRAESPFSMDVAPNLCTFHYLPFRYGPRDLRDDRNDGPNLAVRACVVGPIESRCLQDIQRYLLILVPAVLRLVDILRILQCFATNPDFVAPLPSDRGSTEKNTYQSIEGISGRVCKHNIFLSSNKKIVLYISHPHPYTAVFYA